VNLVFEYGRLGMETSSGNPILLPPKAEPMFLNSGVNRMEIRIHSKDYFLLSGDLQKERINKGTVMHKLFEKIETRKDLAPAIHQMVCSGMLTRNEGDEIFSGLDLMLQREPFRDWFSDRWKVLNERDILRPGESKHRPDRVMIQGNQVVVIDYKTGEQGDKDLRQMKGYLSDLRRMGFVECAGFIWYLQSEEIVSVG
jgi:ATP-dependent helicase/nuclease subunit A